MDQGPEQDELVESVHTAIKEAHERLKAAIAAGSAPPKEEKRPGRGSDAPIDTSVPAEHLIELHRRYPEVEKLAGRYQPSPAPPEAA